MSKEKKSKEKISSELKIRQKDPRNIVNVLKLVEDQEDSSKLQEVIKKYNELYEEHRGNISKLSNEEKQNVQMQQDFKRIMTENNKLVLAKDQLEKLSREFQRQNKLLKEENSTRLKQEEDSRKKMGIEFEKAISDFNAMMQTSNEQNLRLDEENKIMAKKLKTIYEEVKNRQWEVDNVAKQIDIERQLAEARFSKQSAEFMVEKDKLLTEKEFFKKKCEYLNAELNASLEKSLALEKTVQELRNQLNGYTGKYEEFQKAIDKSSRVFEHCKSEITHMSDQIHSQKKELLEWQIKNQINTESIRELNIINEQSAKLLEAADKKVSQLSKLCRRLQAERTVFIAALRENNLNPDDYSSRIVISDEQDAEQVGQSAAAAATAKSPVKQEKPAEMKPKKTTGKQKGGKAKKGDDSLTAKETELAELKQKLKKMQIEVVELSKAEEAKLLQASKMEVDKSADTSIGETSTKDEARVGESLDGQSVETKVDDLSRGDSMQTDEAAVKQTIKTEDGAKTEELNEGDSAEVVPIQGELNVQVDQQQDGAPEMGDQPIESSVDNELSQNELNKDCDKNTVEI